MIDRGRNRRYRRAPHLMVHWSGDRLLAENYADAQRVTVTPFVLDLLSRCTTPRTADSLAREFGVRERALRKVLERLREAGLLRTSDVKALKRDAVCSHWDDWNPAARFFHVATKDVRFGPRSSGRRYVQAKLRRTPRPPLTKHIPGSHVRLSAPKATGEFPSVLLQRRTWRAFGRRPLDIATLSTLLNLTSGVQAWADAELEGRVALKTSPSGGARHPIETYVAVLKCSGLRSGLYHYAADRHSLTRVGPVTQASVRAFLPGQRHFAGAGVIVFFSAVVARTMWRYPHARAYRALLVEAGHICQTFCLTATWLGLAPFCTLALADSAIERAIGVDGVTEIVLYAAGAGTRPEGQTWMPRPDRRRCQMEPLTVS